MWGNCLKSYLCMFWFYLTNFLRKWFSLILPPRFRFYSKWLRCPHIKENFHPHNFVWCFRVPPLRHPFLFSTSHPSFRAHREEKTIAIFQHLINPSWPHTPLSINIILNQSKLPHDHSHPQGIVHNRMYRVCVRVYVRTYLYTHYRFTCRHNSYL